MKRRDFIGLMGGVAVLPLAARAEQSARPVIGFMSSRALADSAHMVEAYRRGLQEGGFVEGQNVTIEFRWAHGDYGRLPALAADLVSRRVDVITAVGGEPSPRAAKRATSTIPIVFGMGGDPVADGFVESFSRPGGNLTGVTLMTSLLEPKRLGLLRELAPASVFGALVNPGFAPSARQSQQLREAARSTGQHLVIVEAGDDEGLEAAFASLVRERVGAFLVAADPYFDTRRERIIAFAAEQRLPTIYQFRDYALAGGLLSYGVDITEAYRLFGAYTARILKGARPADLPVQQATKFQLVINLKTARAQGIAISDNLLSLADEVIE